MPGVPPGCGGVGLVRDATGSGRAHVVKVCRNIACVLRGSDSSPHVEEKLAPGGTTTDGSYTFRVECLAVRYSR